MSDFSVTFSTVAFTLTVLLSACSTPAQAPTAALRSLDDGILAGELGNSLDAKARRLAAEAEFKALETGQAGMPVPWKLTEAVYGNVVPQQAYSVGSVNCRRYTHTVNAEGQTKSATGTACRGDDGIWQPLS